jgi:hypothetical protein
MRLRRRVPAVPAVLALAVLSPLGAAAPPSALAALAALAPPAAAAPAGARAIRAVDFRNGFTYDRGEAGRVTVSDGSFQRGSGALAEDRLYLAVVDIDHGDLTGDGIEEAVVTLLENTGGTGQFTWSEVYRMVDGRPRLVVRTPVGDRADGGVHDALIVDGLLVDERYGGDQGACCPVLIERSSSRLRSDGTLVPVGAASRRAFIVATQGETVVVAFRRGTSRATVSMDPGATATLDARGGQRLTVSSPGVRPGQTAVVVSVLRPGGAVIGTLRAPGTWSGVLPVTGRYELRSAPGDAYGPVDVAIR